MSLLVIAEGTAEGPLVNVQDYVSILRLHSEYLRALAEQLETQFAKIEETLQGQNIMTYAEAGSQVDSLMQLSATVMSTAESFHQRLIAFSKKTPQGSSPCPAV
jgi:hypothetical protein